MSKRWKIKAVSVCLSLFNRLKGRFKQSQPLDLATDFNNIVIYSTTALGDLLFNTPAIRAIRQRYPSATITLVAHQKFQQFVEGAEDWNRVVYWNNKVITLPQMLKSFKGENKPELAVLLHSHEPYDYLSAVLAGAQYIIRDNYVDNHAPRDKWLTDYIIGFAGHVIERKLALVAPLGCDTHNIEMKLPIDVPATSIPGVRLVGFQIGASKPERCWPPEYFAAVAHALLSQYDDVEIVLIGGPGEKHLAQQCLQHLDARFHPRVKNHVGSTGIKELISLIKGFELLLTGDTGPLHIAVAAKIPTVSLFVTANPYATGPLQDRHLHEVIYSARYKASQGASQPMTLIKSERVTDAIMKKLESK